MQYSVFERSLTISRRVAIAPRRSGTV
ncbi:hypothetical protein [Coleofasciculus sp. G1-WW12-02]